MDMRGLAVLLALGALLGCSQQVIVHQGPPAPSDDAGDLDPGSGGDDDGGVDTDAGADGGAASRDGGRGGEGGVDAGSEVACATSFVGTAIVGTYGRLDGHLAAVVPTSGPRACRADAGHVHLQLRVEGVVYDVAVNLDTYPAATTAAAPSGAWSEGWHGNVAPLDYVSSLGLHAGDFDGATTGAALEQDIESALDGADEVSIYATPYDPTGAHDVHRRGGADGAIFVYPSGGGLPRVLAFRFATDVF